MSKTVISHAGDRTMLMGVGVMANDALTAAEAIEQGGLDWDVELRKTAYQNAKGNWAVDGATQKIVRSDNETPFATVGGRYHCIQNRDLFEFADTLVDDVGARYESAWSERNGRTVGLTMRFPDEVLIGGEDAYNKYLLLRSTHDGKGSVKVAVSMVRLSCTNMVTGALRNSKQKFSIPHINGARAKIAAARSALQLTFNVEDAFTQEMEQLLNNELSAPKIESLVKSAFSASLVSTPAVERHTAAVIQNLEHSLTIPDEYRGTQYGVVQATTEHLQWLSPGRTQESTLSQNLNGWRGKASQLVAVV